MAVTKLLSYLQRPWRHRQSLFGIQLGQVELSARHYLRCVEYALKHTHNCDEGLKVSVLKFRKLLGDVRDVREHYFELNQDNPNPDELAENVEIINHRLQLLKEDLAEAIAYVTPYLRE